MKAINTTLSKWGNSLAIRIPASIIDAKLLQCGDSLAITLSETGQIILEPQHKELNFAKLYAQITPENNFEEISSGQSLGNETAPW